MIKKTTRLFDFAYNQLKTNPQQKCFNYKIDSNWVSTSTEQYIEQANTISRALLRLGIKPNDKIAVVTTNNRVEWSILDIAVLQIGAVNVPLYPTISSSDYQYIINHSDAVLCFVSDKDLAKKVVKIKDKTKLKNIYSFDSLKDISSWESLLELGKDNNGLYSKNISIDFGIMEKATNVHVLPTNFGWNDLGTWASLQEKLKADEHQNSTIGGAVIFRDAKGNIVKTQSGKKVVIQGLNDFIVVEKKDVLLICPKNKEQEIKEITAEVKSTFGDKFV